MTIVVVCIASALAAGLTLVSGFGFGTLMLPVFALFLPVETAIGAVAIVHLANNVFKLALIGKWADRRVVLRFGPAAALGALLGAGALALLARGPVLARYPAFGAEREVTLVKAIVAALIVIAVAFEAAPRLARIALPRRWIGLGALLSGFFGGLSGHQGALRMAALRRWDLSKEALLGTSAVCAAVIDVSRLVVYGASEIASHGARLREGGVWWLVGASCLGAFFGSIVAARLVKKTTLRAVRMAMVGMMVISAGLLGAGVI